MEEFDLNSLSSWDPGAVPSEDHSVSSSGSCWSGLSLLRFLIQEVQMIALVLQMLSTEPVPIK